MIYIHVYCLKRGTENTDFFLFEIWQQFTFFYSLYILHFFLKRYTK